MPKTNLNLLFSRNYVYLLKKINLAPNLLIIINVYCMIIGAKTLSSKNKIKGGDNQADTKLLVYWLECKNDKTYILGMLVSSAISA